LFGVTVKIPDEEKREKLSTLLSLFDTAMLVTRTGDGAMRARPLSIAESQDEGAMYFSTAIDSPKVHELEADPHVNVVMQDGRRFVSVSGIATVVRDSALIERLWRASWKVWFPQGKGDPSLCLLRIDPTDAAYWDMTGTTGIRYVFEMAKAYVKGARPPSDDDERHTAHVKL
jgi:general stress protein 26